MKTIKVEPKDRIELLRYVNILRELNCNTSEKMPIYYEHLCELESFMYKLSKILDPKSEVDLKETLGHTKLEVFVGSLLGPLVTLLGIFFLGSPLKIFDLIIN